MTDSTAMVQEFSLKSDIVYLNHAAVGVWPRRTAAAVKAFAEENMQQGAADYPGWMKTERALRRQLARLIGAASEDDIALVKNTSEGLSLIAFGLAWQAGDNMVSTRQEFPSNRMVWEVLAQQGVELRLVDIEAEADPEAAIERCMDSHTRLVSVSSVQFEAGFRLDLERIGQACKRHDMLFCVDAIQSLAAFEFDVGLYHADFVVADGHKWMLGPEGVALFYSRPEARECLKLLQYGWHMTAQAGNFDCREWQPSLTARRFEPGSPNMLGIHALQASLSLFEEVGMMQVESLLKDKANQLREYIRDDRRLMLVGSDDPARYSGIVAFRVQGLDGEGHAALYRRLMSEGMICAMRGSNIRLSPHFYTPDDALDRFWQRLFADESLSSSSRSFL